MKLKIILDGNTYTSETKLENAEEMATKHFVNAVKNTVSEFSSFMMELDNGEFLIMGPEACSRAVFLYVPSP